MDEPPGPTCPLCEAGLEGFFLGDDAILTCPECGPVGLVKDLHGTPAGYSFFAQGAFGRGRRPPEGT
ncbi:MAG: hypothetical protein ACT4PT_14265 [Methanobacteriota archaeon]